MNENSEFLTNDWAIEPSALQEILSYDFDKLPSPLSVAPHAPKPMGAESKDSANLVDREREFARQFDEQLEVKDGVATLRIAGPMMPSPGIMARYYLRAADSTRIAMLIRTATESPDIRALVMVIDSPGGMVIGTPEIGTAIREFNESGKTSFAHSTIIMASAAYWVGSQATIVTSCESTMVGSIGVIRPHLDASGAYEKMGLKIEIFRGGKHKVPGAMNTAMTDEQRADIQAGVNATHDKFKLAVNSRRNIDESLMEGQVFYGEDALKNGLIDSVETSTVNVYRAALSGNNSVLVDTSDEGMSQEDTIDHAKALAEAEANLATANESIDSITAENAALKAEVETLKADVPDTAAIAAIEGERDAEKARADAADAEVARLTAEAEEAKVDFDAKVEAAAKEKAPELAAAEAARIAASSSSAPVDGEAADDSEDADNAKFAGMSDDELWAEAEKIRESGGDEACTAFCRKFIYPRNS